MPEQQSGQQARLIRGGELVVDDSRAFQPPEGDGQALPPDEPGWVVPLDTWLGAQDALRARSHPVAVQISPDDDVARLAGESGAVDPRGIAFIAVSFPVYTDGRCYSQAQLLRQRYGWQGELRAVGDVMIDTIHYQARCGFDSFLVKPGHDPHRALAAFGTFTQHYQQAYPKPVPPQRAA